MCRHRECWSMRQYQTQDHRRAGRKGPEGPAHRAVVGEVPSAETCSEAISAFAVAAARTWASHPRPLYTLMICDLKSQPYDAEPLTTSDHQSHRAHRTR